MGVFIKNMQKPKRGEVIAFDGENAVYTDDDLKVHRYPLIEIDLVRCSECKHWHEGEWYNTCDKHIGNGFPSDYFCGDGERRTDEKQSKDN